MICGGGGGGGEEERIKGEQSQLCISSYDVITRQKYRQLDHCT